MIPIQVTFVPIYVMVSRLGWINSFPGLIVPNLVSAFSIFLLRQAFMSVDDSYLDAGRVDGLNRIGLIFNVLVPMCAPMIITVSILSFINSWNSYFWPKMVATKAEYCLIAVGVTRLRQTFAGMETANYNEIMAGAVLAIIPIVILFLILQKYIMTGMSKAAMK
jgi:ABC-type glycerol-3-phosphate transport system permease component